MKAAGEMVLPLCHHFRPLDDSSWCQALGNTGNESHPRAPAPAGGFTPGLQRQRSQGIFHQWEEGMQQDTDARGSVVFAVFKPASPP